MVDILTPIDPAAESQQHTFYGNNRVILASKEPEIMLSGPRDTGKTLAWCQHIDHLAWEWPRFQGLIMRKVRADMDSTVLQTFQKKILRQDRGRVQPYGGEKPQWFDYPNGSRIWVAGFDKPGKVLSGEFDFIYVNQAEELSMPEWEVLTSTATGRAGHMPWAQTVGDCNPASPLHWIKDRAKKELLTFLETNHRDNPEIFDPKTGKITEQGERRLAALSRLTGSRRLRLFQGLWAQPEGAIYEVFDEEKHRVASFPIPPTWPRVVGVDPLGAYTAAIWIAYDPVNAILNVYREYYEPFGATTPGHVTNILELSKGETIFAWVGGGPSERQARADWGAAGIPLLEPPIGDVWAGIDRINQLFGEFKLVVHDICINLLSEIGSYRRKLKDGQPTEQIESKETFHLLDSLRYPVVWLTHVPEDAQEIVYNPIRIGPNY